MFPGDTKLGLRDGTFKGRADVLRNLNQFRIGSNGRLAFRLPGHSDERRERRSQAPLTIRVL